MITERRGIAGLRDDTGFDRAAEVALDTLRTVARLSRIGVYTDLVFRQDDDGVLSTDLSFVLFVSALASDLDEVVFFGRLDPRPGRAPYVLPRDGVRLVALPHYERLTSVGRVAASIRGARAALRRELDGLDALWVFGPHPLALVFARFARRRGTPVFLGVRQDLPQYIAGRLPSRRWAWAIPCAHLLEHAFRRLARSVPTVVVGAALARSYAMGGGPVLDISVSLVRQADLVSAEVPASRSWEGELRVLSIGRLDGEKNPLLLPEILAGLRRDDESWKLTVVGTGNLRDAVEERARELGVSTDLDLRGYVAFGEPLWELYRSSHAFLHVSLTEGVPQVLLEAQAAGLPIVATDVGGVGVALDDGRLGLLVPPGDSAAAVKALRLLRADSELRLGLARAGLQSVADKTLDAELDRVVRFFESQLAREPPSMRST